MFHYLQIYIYLAQKNIIELNLKYYNTKKIY